ncbi:MAG: TRAP transporter permease [Dehalobacterium sp.]
MNFFKKKEVKSDSGEQTVKKRNLLGTKWGKVLTAFAVAMSVFHFTLAGTGGMTPLLLRAVHLAFAASLIFLLYPFGKRSPHSSISIFDGIGIVLIWACAINLMLSFQHLAERAGNPAFTDVLFGAIAMVIVLEITRRTTGWLLTVIGILVLLYAYFGPYMPGLLAHRGFGVEKIVTYMYTTTDGLFGVTLGVSATYIFFFILFGAFLESMGAGKIFIELAYSLTGRRKGGPAQTVVLANGLMSTISGVPAADVVTIGAFTFPMLNKLGYDKIFTSALSAVASTGAMITPPVMGSAAFLMAEMTGLPYRDICFSAIIPAALFYISLFAMTHFYASKYNMVGVKAEELPKAADVLRKGWYNLVPIIVLIYLLIVMNYSPMMSGFYSVWSLIIVSFLAILVKGLTKSDLKEFGLHIFTALKKAALGALPVVATCALAGFLVGVLNLTGLGLKFTSILLAWANGNLFLALLFGACASIILGMGLPIAACYVILAVLVAPALIQMGLTPMAAHLFILFFGAFSAITPPVAIAAYAAAAMNNIDPIKVGIRACQLALAAFIIPFMFVYGPPLLMDGSLIQIIEAFVTGTLGVICMSGCIMGWFSGNLNKSMRMVLCAAALLMIYPGAFTDIIGFAVLCLLVFWQRVNGRRRNIGNIQA